MKKFLLAAVGLLLVLGTSSAWCEDESAAELRQPLAVERLSLERDMYLAPQEPESAGSSPSDSRETGNAQAGAEKAGDAPGTYCCPGNCDPKCAAKPPWTLPQPCILQNMGIKMGGWLQQGVTVNGMGREQGFNGPVGTNDFNGEYQMNQMWLFFDRPMQNDGCGWGLGGRVDMIYGTDWRFGINHGLEDRINAFDRQSYGLVIPQMYMEIGYDDLSVKLGHMDDLLGYENVPAVLNPLYSHAYAMAFSEPLLVTGVIATYKLTEHFSVWGGFTRGWMQWEDYNGALDYMFGFKWTNQCKGTELDWGLCQGPQDPLGQQDRIVSVFVLKQKLGEKWQYIFQQDYGVQKNSLAGTGPVGDAAWYGINQYFLYTINPKWKAICRAEWFRDDDGVRVFGPPPAAGIRAWPEGPGFAGNFSELTLGLNYRPHSNVLFRPEVRWDWYHGSTNVDGQLPFGAGDSSHQFLFGVDMIVTY